MGRGESGILRQPEPGDCAFLHSSTSDHLCKLNERYFHANMETVFAVDGNADFVGVGVRSGDLCVGVHIIAPWPW